jgi:hypothetical protein
MTADQLAREQPELFARITQDATRAERERLAALNAMTAPGLEEILRIAKEAGTQPAAVAMDCFEILRDRAATIKNAAEPEKRPGGRDPVAILKASLNASDPSRNAR